MDQYIEIYKIIINKLSIFFDLIKYKLVKYILSINAFDWVKKFDDDEAIWWDSDKKWKHKESVDKQVNKSQKLWQKTQTLDKKTHSVYHITC